jgi:transglutaminase-like putative cysteine protease
MTRVYQVTHSTEYAYEAPVSSSYAQLHLLPRDLPGQQCRSAQIRVQPTPDLYSERIDFFGNRVSFFALHRPHMLLNVTATSVVEVQDRAADLSLFGEQSWERVRDLIATGGDQIPDDIAQYALESPQVQGLDRYRAYADQSFTPGAGIFQALTSLLARIHSDFEYAPGSTSVTTPLTEAFERRRGVCQDFAHLAIACLRVVGLPASYVSGYLETDPPPGRQKLTGVDGSHAWLSVFIPEAGWIDIDPTNNQFVGGRYVVNAIGRDYSDVPPMNGVIYTEGRTERLEVKVDVTALEDGSSAQSSDAAI